MRVRCVVLMDLGQAYYILLNAFVVMLINTREDYTCGDFVQRSYVVSREYDIFVAPSMPSARIEPNKRRGSEFS